MEVSSQNQIISSLPFSFPQSFLRDPDPRDPPPIPMEIRGASCQWKSEGTYKKPLTKLSLYSDGNNKNSEKPSILYQSFSISKIHVYL